MPLFMIQCPCLSGMLVLEVGVGSLGPCGHIAVMPPQAEVLSDCEVFLITTNELFAVEALLQIQLHLLAPFYVLGPVC